MCLCYRFQQRYSLIAQKKMGRVRSDWHDFLVSIIRSGTKMGELQ
jgi:hypothetical protein